LRFIDGAFRSRFARALVVRTALAASRTSNLNGSQFPNYSAMVAVSEAPLRDELLTRISLPQIATNAGTNGFQAIRSGSAEFEQTNRYAV
jgi:hypothetical protein